MAEPSRSVRPALDSTQQILFDALYVRNIEGKTILEVGCGDGRLHRRLLEEGAASAVGIELQKRYIATAKEHARAEELEDRTTYYSDNFMELASTLEPADIVILDKVLHCTHDPERLIRMSIGHARSLYAVAFPAPRPLLRTSIQLLSPLLRLILPFRVRFSPPERIRAWIRENGFGRVFRQETEMWHVEIYCKAATSDPDVQGAPGLAIHRDGRSVLQSMRLPRKELL